MLRKNLCDCARYGATFFRWLFCGVLIGGLCGLVGAFFAMAVEKAGHLFAAHSFLLYCLPVAGLVIAFLYKSLRLPLSLGTDEIISTVRSQKSVPLRLAPAIFAATTLTHLFGGSAGREGAALQLGGSIGAAVGHIAKPKEDTRRIFELCGMAALFSALFGTPLTAAVFVLEIIDVGLFNHRALFPCLISALTAKLTAAFVGASPEAFPFAAGGQEVTALSLVQALGLGIVCALCAMLFCKTMHVFARQYTKRIPNDFVRIGVGGLLVIVCSLLFGRDYNGGGMGVILSALAGNCVPWAFLLKILFTALTLGAGFKGGEIVPSFFIGATLGCTVAPLVGLAPGMGAALGLVGVFCGVTNAPLASLLLSAELFGIQYLPLFGVVAAVSFLLSGHFSLYNAQRFAMPKLGHLDE